MKQNSLVLYKDRPALILSVGDKVQIQTEQSKSIRARAKDVQLLHPGPLTSLSGLKQPSAGDFETAWELMAGETTTLAELAELIYDEFTPASAWATWQQMQEGLHFYGAIDAVVVRTPTEVTELQRQREAKAAEEQAWRDAIARLSQHRYQPEDVRYLQEVEQVAYGRQTSNRVLKALNLSETPETSHQFLRQIGYWLETVNPYPQRVSAPLDSPTFEIPDLPIEDRLDLTHLAAYAIDDMGSTDPDDAISLDGSRLWVHVADVGALIPPDSMADIEARARGANLYLPEGTHTMLPRRATEILGLGLQATSPALSIGLDLDDLGTVVNVEITPSWVNVTRTTYEAVEEQLAHEPFASFHELAQLAAHQREANGAIQLELPEVKIRVKDDEISIKPIRPLNSRAMVTEAMLLAGQAVAEFALDHDIPVPFSTQDAPDTEPAAHGGLAGMFALRRTLKRSQLRSAPGLHAGLGLDRYTQVTSPLRRYLDLVTHQQLRAFLRDEPLLSEGELIERVGAFEAVNGNLRQAERLSKRHWTMVYLQRNKRWQGRGVMVEQWSGKAKVIIPELDVETNIPLKKFYPLNTEVIVELQRIRLEELESSFKIVQVLG